MPGSDRPAEGIVRELPRLRQDFDAALAEVRDPEGLQEIRTRFLGRKSGELTLLFGRLGKLKDEERREAGRELNTVKQDVESRLEARRAELETRLRDEQLLRDRVDVTLPGRMPPLGRRHPLTVVREQLEDIFVSMGYEIYDSFPEIDDDFHCF
jgi:phenylalanyl-tRNA synthetase alpha chain